MIDLKKYLIKNNELEPNDDCKNCKRLEIFRKKNKIEEPQWHNKPVKSFGSINYTSERLTSITL